MGDNIKEIGKMENKKEGGNISQLMELFYLIIEKLNFFFRNQN